MNEIPTESATFSALSRIDTKLKHLCEVLSPIMGNFPSENVKEPEPPTELQKRLIVIDNEIARILDSIKL